MYTLGRGIDHRVKLTFSSTFVLDSCHSKVAPILQEAPHLLDEHPCPMLTKTEKRFAIKSTGLSINHYIIGLTHKHHIVTWNIEQARPLSVSSVSRSLQSCV